MACLSIFLALASTAQQDILRSHLDPSIKPAVDFFHYANGGWLKHNPIPATESSWGIGNLVSDELNLKLRKIDETAAQSNAAPGSDEQKVGDFWAVAMDEAKADSLGLTPLKPDLDRIDAINSVQDAIDVGFELHQIAVEPFFDFEVSQDEKHSDQMAVQLGQGGLGLPNRDYYLKPSAEFVKIRAEYAKHLQSILELSGDSDAATEAPTVLAFETALAQASRRLEDLRDPEHNYNKMSIEQVQSKLTPSISWGEKLQAWNLKPSFVIVGQPEFFSSLDALIAKTPAPTLRAYLRFHLVNEFAPYLSKQAKDLDFHFYHEVITGQKKQQPRWKSVLRAENGAIGEVLGRIFVKDYFPPSAKKRYSDLIENIRSAYHHRIDRLTWMSPATKAKAHFKLNAVRKKVGFPDKWKNYSTLVIDRSSFCGNMMSAKKWRFDDMVSKFGKPVDRSEWDITPQTFDAYYDPSNNEIVMPAAGFAVPGLKESQIDDAIIYGNAGAGWIGHEMTHGFDDQGRQFDAKGNLANWWTKEDAAKFQKRAAVMVKQFNKYEPLPGLHINGSACLGENIADFGGVLLGLDAFKQTETYRSGKKVAGMTPLQRFFLAYALGWMEHSREQALRRQLLSDVHSPAEWRVIGPLSNIPDFYRAFGVKPGQPMWRPADQRVHIW